MLLFFCCSAPSLNRYHIFETSIWVYYHGQHTCSAIFHEFFFFFFPVCAARFMIIPLWHRRLGTAPLTPAIWLSHTTLGYTVAHSAIDWGVEGQLFNTSEQQVLLSSWLFSCLIFAPPKNVPCLLTGARWQPAYACVHHARFKCNHDRHARLLRGSCTWKEPLGGI